MPLEPVTLDTDRLILRPWREGDRDAFAAMNASPEVMRYFPSPLDREESDAMLDRISANIEDRGWGYWAAELKADRRLIGFVGLNVPSAALPFSPCVEVGWRLITAHWGKGLATEAARAAVAFGFEKLELTKIVSFTAVINARSIAVMKRLGMTAVQEFDHPAVPEGSPLRRHMLYELVR
jgi:RimJ/RimL family protein N-acetyltransferase